MPGDQNIEFKEICLFPCGRNHSVKLLIYKIEKNYSVGITQILILGKYPLLE